MHIEIIGMSGAGKSTLIKELLKSGKFLDGRPAVYDYSLIKKLFKKRVTLKGEDLKEFEKNIGMFLICIYHHTILVILIGLNFQKN